MHKRSFFDDMDPAETREWLEALESVVEREGPERAAWLLDTITNEAQEQGIHRTHLNTPYLNTIPAKDEVPIPSDIFMERRVRSLVRWNALATVMRANMNDDELGAILPPLRPPPLFTMWDSIISSGPPAIKTKGTWCFSRAIPRRGCMPALTWKGASAKSSWTTFVGKWMARACPPTRTPG